MTDILKRYATPFITGLFLISLVSGVALFFHVGQSAFHGMHEWLSMVLILPFVLHLWRNWRAMLNYVGRAPFTLAMVVSLVAGLTFAWPAISGSASTAGGPPPFALAATVVSHSAKDVAPVLGLTPDELVEGLKGQGYASATIDQPLADIAKATGKESFALMETLVALKK